MKNLSTVKSVRRKSALWCVVCINKNQLQGFAIYSIIVCQFIPTKITWKCRVPVDMVGLYFPIGLEQKSPYWSFPNAYIFSYSVLLEVCNISSYMWWLWSFWNGEVIVQVGDVVQPPVLNTDLISATQAHIYPHLQIHLDPCIHSCYLLTHFRKVTKYKI